MGTRLAMNGLRDLSGSGGRGSGSDDLFGDGGGGDSGGDAPVVSSSSSAALSDEEMARRLQEEFDRQDRDALILSQQTAPEAEPSVSEEAVPSELSLGDWLATVQLQRYADAIKEAGYDELEFLKDADESDIDDLVTEVTMKKPHVKTFKRALAGLVQAAELTSNGGGGGGGGGGGAKEEKSPSDDEETRTSRSPPLFSPEQKQTQQVEDLFGLDSDGSDGFPAALFSADVPEPELLLEPEPETELIFGGGVPQYILDQAAGAERLRALELPEAAEPELLDNNAEMSNGKGNELGTKQQAATLLAALFVILLVILVINSLDSSDDGAADGGIISWGGDQGVLIKFAQSCPESADDWPWQSWAHGCGSEVGPCDGCSMITCECAHDAAPSTCCDALLHDNNRAQCEPDDDEKKTDQYGCEWNTVWDNHNGCGTYKGTKSFKSDTSFLHPDGHEDPYRIRITRVSLHASEWSQPLHYFRFYDKPDAGTDRSDWDIREPDKPWGWNDCSSSIAMLSSLSALVYLDLSGYSFSGSLDALSKMNSMKHLDLSDTNVEGSIQALSTMSELKYLDISNAAAVYGSVEQLTNCRHLLHLVLSGTSVTGLLSALSPLIPMVQILKLDNTEVSGDISGLNPLPKLSTLWLNHTAVHGDVSAIACTNLSILDLSYTAATGDFAFETFQYLELLYLTHTRVGGSVDKALSLNRLGHLDASGSDLGGSLTGVRALNMCYLCLRNTSVTGNFDNLGFRGRLLDLSATQVTGSLDSSWRADGALVKESDRSTACADDATDSIFASNFTRATIICGISLNLSHTAINGNINRLRDISVNGFVDLSHTAVQGSLSEWGRRTRSTNWGAHSIGVRDLTRLELENTDVEGIVPGVNALLQLMRYFTSDLRSKLLQFANTGHSLVGWTNESLDVCGSANPDGTVNAAGHWGGIACSDWALISISLPSHGEFSGNIEELGELITLRALNFAGTEVFGDISFIATLSELVTLNVANTRIHGAVETLMPLTSLRELHLEGSQVSFGRGYGAGLCPAGKDISSVSLADGRHVTSLPVMCSLCPRKNRCAGVGNCSVVGTGGSLCASCAQHYYQVGSSCHKCASPVPTVVLVCVAIILLARIFWYFTALPDLFHMNCVLSFGSRDGGFEYARELKEDLAERFYWPKHTIYIDRDALPGKEGTTADLVRNSSGKALYTRYLNPDWHKFYREAMVDAPAMLFSLTKSWCESPFCKEELVWFLVLKTAGNAALTLANVNDTGVEDLDTAEILNVVRSMPETQRSALWDGAFFLADEFSANSDIVQLLRDLGCPTAKIKGRMDRTQVLIDLHDFVSDAQQQSDARFRRKQFLQGYTATAIRQDVWTSLDTRAFRKLSHSVVKAVSVSLRAQIVSIFLPNFAYALLPLFLPFHVPKVLVEISEWLSTFVFLDFGGIASPECFASTGTAADSKSLRFGTIHGTFWAGVAVAGTAVACWQRKQRNAQRFSNEHDAFLSQCELARKQWGKGGEGRLKFCGSGRLRMVLGLLLLYVVFSIAMIGLADPDKDDITIGCFVAGVLGFFLTVGCCICTERWQTAKENALTQQIDQARSTLSAEQFAAQEYAPIAQSRGNHARNAMVVAFTLAQAVLTKSCLSWLNCGVPFDEDEVPLCDDCKIGCESATSYSDCITEQCKNVQCEDGRQVLNSTVYVLASDPEVRCSPHVSNALTIAAILLSLVFTLPLWLGVNRISGHLRDTHECNWGLFAYLVLLISIMCFLGSAISSAMEPMSQPLTVTEKTFPFVGWFGAIIYGNVIPALLYRVLYYNFELRKHSGVMCPDIYHTYGFLFTRLKVDCWQHEFVIMLRKVSILLVVTLFGDNPFVVFPATGFILLWALGMQITRPPFSQVGRVESNCSCICRTDESVQWTSGDTLETMGLISQLGSTIVVFICALTGPNRSKDLEYALILAILVLLGLPLLFAIQLVLREAIASRKVAKQQEEDVRTTQFLAGAAPNRTTNPTTFALRTTRPAEPLEIPLLS
eukprot:COSAG01_NODE_490_length_16356_cov_34.781898_8_plen_2008_part_00